MDIKLKKIDAIIIVALILIAAIVLIRAGYVPDPIDPEPPNIVVFQDDAEKKLIIQSVDREVLWEDIRIVESKGSCDKSGLGTNVVEGDEVSKCEGTITFIYDPTDDVLGEWVFTPVKKLPGSIILSGDRSVTPEDEGEHYKELKNLFPREWWTYTVVFDQDCELPGWTLTVSFNHMSRLDLLFSKPDMLFVVLTSPDGKTYGGVVEEKRPLLGDYAFLSDPVLQTTSSDSGFRVSFDKSYAQGKWPNWHLYVEGNKIDENNDIEIDLKFFAPSSPLWTHNNRIIDKSNAKIASYVFLGCDVTGSVKINGFAYEAKGVGTHEHTWSTGALLTKTLVRGWDWTRIEMDNGWSIYFNNYYLSSQLKSSKEYNFNPYATVLITTDKGNKITILQDTSIKVVQSENVLLLLKIPIETQINSKPGINQVLLGTYNIELDLNLKSASAFDKTWKGLSNAGIKIGSITASGKITWSDDNGDHQVDLNGIGTMWNMRH